MFALFGLNQKVKSFPAQQKLSPRDYAISALLNQVA